MEFNHKLHTGYILGINKRPNVIITTGAGVAVPTIFFAKKATKIQSDLYQLSRKM